MTAWVVSSGIGSAVSPSTEVHDPRNNLICVTDAIFHAFPQFHHILVAPIFSSTNCMVPQTSQFAPAAISSSGSTSFCGDEITRRSMRQRRSISDGGMLLHRFSLENANARVHTNHSISVTGYNDWPTLEAQMLHDCGKDVRSSRSACAQVYRHDFCWKWRARFGRGDAQ